MSNMKSSIFDKLYNVCVSQIEVVTPNDLSKKKISLVVEEAIRFLKQCKEKYNFIFADPPYQMEYINNIPNLVFEMNLLKPNGILVVEHEKNIDFSKHPNFQENRQYGRVNFSFFVE